MLEEKTVSTIKNAPDIPGLTFRPFRGEEDYPKMAALINTCNEAEKVENISTPEDVAHTYRYLQRSDTDKDMLFAEVDGELVAYGRCMWSAEPDSTHLYTFFVHLTPAYRGKGLGEAMANHFIERLREIAQDHPQDAPKLLDCSAKDKMVWFTQLLKRLGFTPARYGFKMTRPCSEPIEIHPLPEGLEVRPAVEENYHQIIDAQIEAFRDHWGFVEPTEKDLERWFASPFFQPEIWQVAWDGDEVAGMVLNAIDKDYNQNFGKKRGYTEDICTRRPWRRRGLARALLTRSIRMFQEMGMEETALGVDTENPSGALNLYLDVGYKEIERNVRYRRPLFDK